MPCAACVQKAGMGDLTLGTVGDISLGGIGAVPWTDVLQQGATTGFEIVKGIFDPRFRPGTAFQQTAKGDISIQRATSGPSAGFQLSTFPSQQFSPASSQLLMWGLIFMGGIVAVKVLSK